MKSDLLYDCSVGSNYDSQVKEQISGYWHKKKLLGQLLCCFLRKKDIELVDNDIRYVQHVCFYVGTIYKLILNPDFIYKNAFKNIYGTSCERYRRARGIEAWTHNA